ncbi:MAG: hypothetical protein LBT26_11370 [Clostridiales Family XIII bacterium]|jgi:hypothetical protein|nr:hypothetical protein [Clostridiales Family XIII bacterium]
MEFSILRDLLNDARTEMGDVFSGGLTQGERGEASLRAMGKRLNGAGLRSGARLLDALCDALAQARVDTAWSADDALRIFAQIWDYLTVCLGRLDYMEAKASLASPG